MLISTCNVQNYVLAALALAGELPATGIGRFVPGASNAYVLSAVSELRKEKLIREYSYPDRRYYRLTGTKGIEAVKEISHALAEQYDMMTGREGARYQGSKDYRLKQRRIYELCALFSRSGIAVNGIIIERNPNFFGEESVPENPGKEEGAVFTPEYFYKRILGEDLTFITSRALRKTMGLGGNARDKMTRSPGILCQEGSIAHVYILGSPNDTWFRDVEISHITQISRLKNSIVPRKNRAIETKRAFFYMKNTKQAADFICEKTARPRLNPGDIYNLGCIIPLDNSAAETTKLLMVKGWKEKANRILIGKTAKGEGSGEDGRTSDGEPIYNFLDANVVQLRAFADKLRKGGAVIIIPEWMEDAARDLYGNGNKFIPVSGAVMEELHGEVLKRKRAER